jgi:hypothetical protein
MERVRVPDLRVMALVFASQAGAESVWYLESCSDRLQPVVKVRRGTEGGDAPGRQGATSAKRGPHRACFARWGAIPGVFERGATQPDPGVPTVRFSARWGGDGMQRGPNAAGLSPRAAKTDDAEEMGPPRRLGRFSSVGRAGGYQGTMVTVTVAVPVRPRLSLTVTRTVRAPADVYE